MTKTEIIKYCSLYYSCYQENIYKILKHPNFSYSWEKIDNCILSKGIDLDEDWEIKNNSWLMSNINKKIELARDIVKRGTYSPFLSNYEGKNLEGKNIYSVICGGHRIYALKELLKLQEINKDFLFIYSNRFYLEKPITLYNLEFDNFKETKFYNKGDIFYFMGRFIDVLNDFFFQEGAIPLSIINNKEALENLLKNGVII